MLSCESFSFFFLINFAWSGLYFAVLQLKVAIVLVRAHFTVPARKTEVTKCSQHIFSLVQRIHLKNEKQSCEHIIIQLLHNPQFWTFWGITSVIACNFILEATLSTIRLQNTVHHVPLMLSFIPVDVQSLERERQGIIQIIDRCWGFALRSALAFTVTNYGIYLAKAFVLLGQIYGWRLWYQQ